MVYIILVLVGILAAYLIVRYGRGASPENDGLHDRRVGDGLRRLNANKEKFASLTPALLEQTPDERLLEAVLSNLWAKMRPGLEDAPAVVAAQSAARQQIYALYAVSGGVRQDGFAKLMAGPDAAFLPIAEQALDALAMPQSAALLRAAREAGYPNDYSEPYAETFEGEGGKARMTAFIRNNPEAFSD